MSLVSLKKRTPSAEPRPVSVDDFIQGAEIYACGGNREINIALDEQEAQPMRHATFTLSDQAIQQLAALSSKTNIAKSRLIRIWLDTLERGGNLAPYMTSTLR